MIAVGMLDPSSAVTAERTLGVSRIVVGSLLFGLVAFAGVVVFVTDDPGDFGQDFMLQVAAAVLVIGVVASFGAGRFLQAFYRKRDLSDEDLLARAFFQTTVVRAAALEAPGFLCLVTYMISGQKLALAGAGVCFALIAALFPTRASWERFHAEVTGSGGRFEPL